MFTEPRSNRADLRKIFLFCLASSRVRLGLAISQRPTAQFSMLSTEPLGIPLNFDYLPRKAPQLSTVHEFYCFSLDWPTAER